MNFDKTYQTKKFFAKENSCRYIMLHHTASTAPDVNMVRYLALNQAPVSCHDMVGRDGKIWNIADSKRSTRHAGEGTYEGIVNTMNFHAIGIEVHSDGYSFTDAQRKSVADLIRYYMNKHNISLENVIRHVDYSAPRKRDIGDNFWNNNFKTFEQYKTSLVANEEKEEGYNIVDKGIWNGERPNDPATRREVAIMIERALLLQYNDILGEDPSKEDLNFSDIPDGAFEDDGTSIDSSRTILPKDVDTCKFNYFQLIRRNKKLQLSQDEFKKKSKRCTVYTHFANYLHNTGKNISKKDRKRVIAWYIKNTDLGEEKGANTMKIADVRGRCLNELGIYKGEIETYYFKTGSRRMNYLMLFKNQCFVSSTVMNEGLANDRKDDRVINADVHGGDLYGGHAHCYAAIDMKHIGFVNSYSDRKINHFAILRGHYKDRFHKKRDKRNTYVRKYSALHIYKNKLRKI